jgi:hypothetical protein
MPNFGMAVALFNYVDSITYGWRDSCSICSANDASY